jgi:hypothetical protein
MAFILWKCGTGYVKPGKSRYTSKVSNADIQTLMALGLGDDMKQHDGG